MLVLHIGGEGQIAVQLAAKDDTSVLRIEAILGGERSVLDLRPDNAILLARTIEAVVEFCRTG